MTDYRSASYVPVVPGDLFQFRGEINLEDAYVISQDVSALQRQMMAVDYALPHSALVSREDGLSWTGVMEAFDKAPQSHAKPSAPIPVGAVAVMFLGIVLVALGLVLNDPVSQLIWEMITRA